MYAIACYRTEQYNSMASLDRHIRDWLGQNASPETWDTCWASGSLIGPILTDSMDKSVAITVMIDLDDEATLFTGWFEGKTDILAHYQYSILLSSLDLKIDRYDLRKEIMQDGIWPTMWTDGLYLFYKSKQDLIYLKLRHG